ncbi:hypothetical protein [Geodermatophilus nigrescens]|uniref:Uncharacterized protein n=1 Tax=Geodermatophilus nigrescens TaxID=1070870 RepID=A0A1M5NRY8_9ACTN|nr:hypothetical protein [Geodermatophilus nigrescens]SHG92302.1 hypothetical protein SAMN05444351_3666 [Geodermatophilus nigrescens]
MDAVARFDIELAEALRRGELEGRDDLSVAIALAGLVHKNLEAHGTRGDLQLDDDDIKTALLALRAVLRRLGIMSTVPFRDFTSFRSYWLNNDASGSEQARRDRLEELFEPVHVRLIRLEEATFEALVESRLQGQSSRSGH